MQGLDLDSPLTWSDLFLGIVGNVGLIIAFLSISIFANRSMLSRQKTIREAALGGAFTGANLKTPLVGRGPASNKSYSSNLTTGGDSARFATTPRSSHMTYSPSGSVLMKVPGDSNAKTPTARSSRVRGQGNPVFQSQNHHLGHQQHHHSNASFGGNTATPTNLLDRDPANNASFTSAKSGDDLDSLADEALLQQAEEEVDLSRFFGDSITVFYLAISLYGLIMSIVTGFVVLALSSSTYKVGSSETLVLTLFPVVAYYLIAATLTEKLIGLPDLFMISESWCPSWSRRAALAFFAVVPITVGVSVNFFIVNNEEIQIWTPVADSLMAALFSGLLIYGAIKCWCSEIDRVHRLICLRVGLTTAFFIAARGITIFPLVQNLWNDGTLSIPASFIIFNVATVVPVIGTLLVLKVRPSSNHHQPTDRAET